MYLFITYILAYILTYLLKYLHTYISTYFIWYVIEPTANQGGPSDYTSSVGRCPDWAFEVGAVSSCCVCSYVRGADVSVAPRKVVQSDAENRRWSTGHQFFKYLFH